MRNNWSAKPLRQWTLDQLAADLGLSVAEIQLHSTETKAVKIVASFKSDQNRIAKLDQEIDRVTGLQQWCEADLH